MKDILTCRGIQYLS